MASVDKLIRIVLQLEDKMSGELDKASSRLSSLGANLTKAGAALTAGLTVPIVAGLAKAASTAIEFESAWTSVRKTVDGSVAEMDALRASLDRIATEGPVAALENAHVQLYEIAAAAGQLGVKQKDIAAFSDVIAQLSMTTNIAGEEGAQMIAQFANVAKMPLSEIRNFGDTIVTLGNNLATTENDILRFSQRLGSLSDINFNPEEIMAYGAAMASLGINAELGGTNFVKGAQEMALAAAQGGEALSMMADMTNMTEQAFATLMKSDPSEAIYRFVNALGDMNLEQQVQALDMLNLTGTEARRVFQSLAGNSELLADALGMAGTAMEGNGALFDEAAKRAEETAGQMNILKNNLNQMWAELGAVLLPVINQIVTGLTDMVRWFNSLPQGIKEGVVWIGVMVAAVGPLLMLFGSLISAITTLKAAFAAGGLLAGLAPLLAAAGPLLAVAAAIVAVGIAANKAMPLIKQMGEIAKLSFEKMKQSFSESTLGKNLDMAGEIIRLGIQKIINHFMNLQEKVADYGGWKKLMHDVGKNIVMGLITGITSMVSSLVNAVKNMASKAANSVKQAFGIASPSKLMMRYGEEVVNGFTKGIDSMGGIGVTTPALSPVSASSSPAMSSGAIGGGGGLHIHGDMNITVPPGTTREQAREISKYIAKEYYRQGGIR